VLALQQQQQQQTRSNSRGGVRHIALKRRIRAVVIVNPLVPEAADSSTIANSTSSGGSSTKSLKRSVAALRRVLQPDSGHGECYYTGMFAFTLLLFRSCKVMLYSQCTLITMSAY
jgi:hypothetical protein